MKVFKIVDAKTRKSLVLYNNWGHDTHFCNYVLKYPEGETVTAPEESLGIMCFESMECAKEFINENMWTGRETILQVEGIGKPIRPKRVASFKIRNPLAVFNRLRNSKKSTVKITHSAPRGTICFPAVKVLT